MRRGTQDTIWTAVAFIAVVIAVATVSLTLAGVIHSANIARDLARATREEHRADHYETCERINELEGDLRAVLVRFKVPLSSLPDRRNGTRVLSGEYCGPKP